MSDQTASAPAKPSPISRMTSVRTVHKADTAALVTNGSDSFPEDVYTGSYMEGGSNGYAAIIEPFYKPGDLQAVAQQNNVLMQCVEAMEVNIDGTGHSIELKEDATESESEKQMLADFFNEPYPGKSMITLRRGLRRDLETVGNGYLEVICNVQGEVLMLNSVEPIDFRLVRLDDPILVPRTITRGGKEITVQVRQRQRRYVQLINGRRVYYREFGALRQVNRDTGEWVPEGQSLPIEQQGSSIIHFLVNKEPRTPYGVPRWINQMPSALGSRKAEEFNLEFFDAGGLPPVLILVQGGYLGETVKEDLQKHLQGGGATAHRAAIVEAVSSSGSLDSSGTVQVRVERFGSERQSDSMFMNYDKNCEEHIRVGFRLPPMFIGKAQDYNFATAKTGYMVAEAQVFGPERHEFDSVINNTIVKALGAKNYVFKSQPMNLVDADLQLKGLTLLSTAKATSNEELVSVVNEMTGLSVEYVEPPKEPQPPTLANIDPLTNLPYKNPVDPLAHLATTGKPVQPIAQAQPEPVIKSERASEIMTLGLLWSCALGLVQGTNPTSDRDRIELSQRIAKLEGRELALFNQYMVSSNMSLSGLDQQGLEELAGCATFLAS